MRKTTALQTGFLLIAAFAVWTALIRMIEVRPIGPNASMVGFASLNGWVHQLTGVHMTLYTVTDWLGLVPVFVCMIFAVLGLIQLIGRRSLFKVDRDIVYLGIYYIVVICFYLIFEMFPINYRPVLIEGRLEASYPSSTTLLVLGVMPTLTEQAGRRLGNKTAKSWIRVFVICFCAFMVPGRLISGVHWITDIVGALLLSIGSFFIYKACVMPHCGNGK